MRSWHVQGGRREQQQLLAVRHRQVQGSIRRRRLFLLRRGRVHCRGGFHVSRSVQVDLRTRGVCFSDNSSCRRRKFVCPMRSRTLQGVVWCAAVCRMSEQSPCNRKFYGMCALSSWYLHSWPAGAGRVPELSGCCGFCRCNGQPQRSGGMFGTIYAARLWARCHGY